MLEKLKRFFYNPVYVHTFVSCVQGMWLTLIAYDAFARDWFRILVHLLALSINTCSLHLARRTMFMTIWEASANYHAQRSAVHQVPGNPAESGTDKPNQPG